MRLTTANLPTLESGAIDAILGAYHGDPFAILGLHEAKGLRVVRVFRPGIRSLVVKEKGGQEQSFPAVQVHADGFFEALIEDRNEHFSYVLQCTDFEGHEWTEHDPYHFGPVLGSMDLHLFSEGQHWELYKRLGAQLCERAGVAGTAFAVWAPNARRVSVVGDFNGWDGRRHPMRKLVEGGIWELFIPGVQEGAHYKFELKNAHGDVVLKSDPFAFFSQHGVQTACMVYDLHHYE
jgi:1,4-alpha-glucan branching enzyme